LIASFARRDAIEPIQGPIEAIQLWPMKASAGNIVLGTIF